MTAVLNENAVCESPTLLEPDRRTSRRDFALVCVLTLIAGVSRLATAALPPLWNDEAQTFRRVCGSFAELAAMLREEAFPPLHYYVYWVLGRALGGAQHLTPFWMRFIPALAGTLMVPAMWRLARQLTDRRSALLTAVFATVSAYLFAYSHDAKMYMLFWTLLTFNVSLWISWLRDGGGKYWAGWVLTGVAMVGYHATGIAVLIVEIAWFFVWSRGGWTRALRMVVGVAVILVGPAIYYVWCNDLLSRTRDSGWHAASGLAWIHPYADGKGGADPIIRLSTSYLFAWEWTEAPQGNVLRSAVGSGAQSAFGVVAFVLLIAIVAGSIQWIIKSYREIEAGDRQPLLKTLLLFLWLVLPVYGAYRLSQASIGSSGTLIAAALACFATASAVMTALVWRTLRPRLMHNREGKRAVDAAGIVILAASITWISGTLVSLIAGTGRQPSSVWVPRYLGFVWPAFAIVLCIAMAHLRPATVRWTAIALLVGANIAQSLALIAVDSEPPVGSIVADACAAERGGGELRTYVCQDAPSSPAAAGGTLGNSVGRYYLSVATGNHLGPRGFTEAALDEFVPVRLFSAPDEIRSDLAAVPARRLIIWDYVPSRVPSLRAFAPEPRWQLISDRWFAVRNHWDWETLYFYRRCEFVRRDR